jgi:hypothetical protein
VTCVFLHSIASFLDAATVIHLRFPKPRKVSKTIRLNRLKRRAEPREAFENMTEEITHPKRVRHGFPFELVGRDKGDEMIR